MNQSEKNEELLNQPFEASMNRRSFLQKTAKGVTGAIALSAGIPILLSACSSGTKSAKASTDSMVDLGFLEDIKKGPFPLKVDYNAKLKDGWTTSDVNGFVYFVKNDAGELLILSPVCTHLGCTVPFADDELKAKGVMFNCPCHGGHYDEQGVNVAGPPPRPLDVFNPVIQDNRVYIQVLNPIKREAKANG